MISETQKTYGRLSNIFINGKYPPQAPLPPAPALPFTDENDPGGIQRELLKQRVSDKVKLDAKVEELKPKLYGFIKQHLSRSSMTQIKRHVVEKVTDLAVEAGINIDGNNGEYDNNDADNLNSVYDEDTNDNYSFVGSDSVASFNTITAKAIWDNFECKADPLNLWKAIRSTHQTARLMSSRLDQDKATTSYFTIKQGETEVLDNYKLRFDNAIDTLIACGVAIPRMDSIVTRFIESLNSDYNDLRKDIKNC